MLIPAIHCGGCVPGKLPIKCIHLTWEEATEYRNEPMNRQLLSDAHSHIARANDRANLAALNPILVCRNSVCTVLTDFFVVYCFACITLAASCL